MSQLYTCRGAVATSSGHLGRVPGQPAPFDDLGVFSQDPVHRGDRTQIDALVEQLSVDLQRCQIGEPVTVEHFQDPAPFPISQLVDRAGAVSPTPRAWVRWRRGVAGSPSSAPSRSTPLRAWSRHRGDQRHIGVRHRFLRCSSESALSERVSKRACAFPMMSSAASVVVNRRSSGRSPA